jgi:toxin ParE1/3/4
MTGRVRFRPAAQADLLSIYLYIADHAGPSVAAGYVARMRQACQKLDLMPLRGRPREDLGIGIRTLAFEGRATIAYRVDDVGVRILRIFAAGRDYSSEEIDGRD